MSAHAAPEEAEPFSFSRRLGEPPPENPLSIALAARRSAGLPVLNLAESNPTRAEAGLPPELLARALSQAENARYEPDPRGLLRARQAIAARYARLAPAPQPAASAGASTPPGPPPPASAALAQPHAPAQPPTPAQPQGRPSAIASAPASAPGAAQAGRSGVLATAPATDLASAPGAAQSGRSGAPASVPATAPASAPGAAQAGLAIALASERATDPATDPPLRPVAAVAPADLFCSASTSEAYAWVFKLLCDPGDAILVPRPGYPLFDYLAGLEAVRAEPYRLEYAHPRGWSIDLDALERTLDSAASTAAEHRGSAPAPRIRAIVLIHPNNPTGSYVSGAEREALVALARRYGLVLVVDEVFRSYALDGPEGGSFADESRVPCIVLDGLSKLACAPQLKLGWLLLAGPEPWRRAARERLEIIADAYLSASAAAMNAAPLILADAERRIAALRARLAGNLASLRAAFQYPDSPFRVLACQAGWTALLEVPRLLCDEDLALGLLREEGLLVQPGYLFDLERDGILSVSLLLPAPRFAEGIEGLSRYFARLLAR